MSSDVRARSWNKTVLTLRQLGLDYFIFIFPHRVLLIQKPGTVCSLYRRVGAAWPAGTWGSAEVRPGKDNEKKEDKKGQRGAENSRIVLIQTGRESMQGRDKDGESMKESENKEKDAEEIVLQLDRGGGWRGAVATMLLLHQ